MSTASVYVNDHRDTPHPLTGGTFTVVFPPRGKRITPISLTVEAEELAELRRVIADLQLEES